MAKDDDLDVLRIGVDEQQTTIALSEFIAERRLQQSGVLAASKPATEDTG